MRTAPGRLSQLRRGNPWIGKVINERWAWMFTGDGADEHSAGILGWFRAFPPLGRISYPRRQVLDDRELWKRISAGDTEAFEAWYRKTAPRLHEKTAAKDPYCDFTRKCAIYLSSIYAIETAKLHLCIVPTCRCGDRRSYAQTINRILDKSLHLRW